jgi:hypothetical protein
MARRESEGSGALSQRIKPLAGLFHRLAPSTSKVNEGRKWLGRSICFAFRGSKWYARPVMLRIPALI